MVKYKIMNRSGTLANLRPFTAENQPPNRGRKPSLLKGLTARSNIAASDIRNAIIAIAFDKTEAEVIALAKDLSQPIFIRTICSALEQDFLRGKTNNIEWMLERVVGRVALTREPQEPEQDQLSHKMNHEEWEAFQQNVRLLFRNPDDETRESHQNT